MEREGEKETKELSLYERGKKKCAREQDGEREGERQKSHEPSNLSHVLIKLESRSS